MKLLKTLASALCLALLFTPLLSKAQTLDPTQVYTTGNIVLNTPQGGPTPWVGGVYQDQLTCWGAGDSGNCGPNPTVRPGGVINFSYGTTNLYQMQAIANVLPNSGTGLLVNGYNFGFTAKNGNGWDDGRMDYLTAYVSFYDPKGSTVFNKNYDLNSRFNWTTFNYSETFNSPFASKDLGSVQYGFVGRDNNFWAGTYGPEIYNVNFSLKYSVDPCATNILSSPTCPGYFDALAKLAPQPTMAGLTTETTPVGTTILVDSVLISPTGTYGSLLPPPPDTTQSSSSQQNGPLPPGPTQQASTTQPSSTQTKVGEVSDSGGGSKSTVSLSSVLNMIGSNQEKTAALERSVVQAADAQAFSAGETAKQTAEKIAGDSQSQSIAVSNSQATSSVQTSGVQSLSNPMQSGAVALQGNLQSNTVLNTSRLEQSMASSSSSQQTSNSSGSNQQNTSAAAKQDNVNVGYQFSLQSPKYEPPKIDLYTQPIVNSVQYQPPVIRQELSLAIAPPLLSYNLNTPIRYTSQIQIDTPTNEGIKFGNRNVVETAMEARPFIMQTNDNSQQNSAVVKNVDNNELAGNITIESIAKQPANYSQYFFMMPDVAFYAPKEIYRNQTVTDNVRLLRGLGSDRLHQEMVNRQYKLGE
jgi:hypothetical protein